MSSIHTLGHRFTKSTYSTKNTGKTEHIPLRTVKNAVFKSTVYLKSLQYLQMFGSIKIVHKTVMHVSWSNNDGSSRSVNICLRFIVTGLGHKLDGYQTRRINTTNVCSLTLHLTSGSEYVKVFFSACLISMIF